MQYGLNNKDMTVKSDSFSKDFKEKVNLKVPDKFDLSVIGSIDLTEAEEIAKEEAFFLTENDIMASLENFELVPIKSKDEFKKEVLFEKKKEPNDKIYNLEQSVNPEISSKNDEKVDETVTEKNESKNESSDDLELVEDISDIITFLDDDYIAETDRVNAVEEIEEIKAEPNESKLIDITDSIIILEDKEKLIELTSEFPEKSDHLVKLLSYLDGLFEKLPEDVIRKFAESEYFDLYTKILKDMEL